MSDEEILGAMEMLAKTERVFTETAGGIVVGVACKLADQGRIRPEETTVRAITGNGLKTTETLTGQRQFLPAVESFLASFEKLLAELGAPILADR